MVFLKTCDGEWVNLDNVESIEFYGKNDEDIKAYCKSGHSTILSAGDNIKDSRAFLDALAIELRVAHTVIDCSVISEEGFKK